MDFPKRPEFKPTQPPIEPPKKPSERRHDIQFVRCKCGLSFPSYKEWIEHFKYRYILLNAEKMPTHPVTGQDQNKIDASYLANELMDEIIAEHSGQHSNPDE